MGDEEPNIADVMGFGSFGGRKSGGKHARTFDLDSILAEARKTAAERCGNHLNKFPEKRKHSESEKEFSPEDEKKVITQNNSSDADQDSDEEEQADEAEDGYSDNDDDNEDRLPVSSEAKLNHGCKLVSAVAVDPSGARLVTGGYDYDVRLWDFGAMDSSLRSFRTVTPQDGYQVTSVAYSNTGDCFTVAMTSAHTKVYDRNGEQLLECIRGDHYLSDMTNTKGHVSGVNSTCWHPKQREVFLTCGDDGTVRLWDVNGEGKRQKVVVKARQKQARRLPVTSMTCSSDGRLLVAGCQDGSLQLWPLGGPYVRPSHNRQDAHIANFVSSVTVKSDGWSLLSRGADDKIRLWDIRALRQAPVAEQSHLTTLQPMMNLSLSPSERSLAVPVAPAERNGQGEMAFLDAATLEVRHRQKISTGNPVCCLWHSKLNQIIIGADDGNVPVLYDPHLSLRGVTGSLAKKKKKVISGQANLSPAAIPIITPHSLPLFREKRWVGGRRRAEEKRLDPLASRRPELPLHGHGRGGRIAGGSSLAAYVGQNVAKIVRDDSNPRDAILRHAKDATEDPYWVTPAYKATQPKPVFQDVSKEEEGEDD